MTCSKNRRGRESNPRGGFWPPIRFRIGAVMTTSVPLHLYETFYLPTPGGIKLTELGGMLVLTDGAGYLSLIFAEESPAGITVRGMVLLS